MVKQLNSFAENFLWIDIKFAFKTYSADYY